MTSSEIFIKSCREKNANQYIVDHFSKDPQAIWDSMENPNNMLYLLSKFSGKVDSTSRKAHIKCLIEIVKPCMVNIPEKEKRPGILMKVLERYCEGTATLEEVEKAQYNYNDFSDASRAVCYCAGFAIEKYDYYYYAYNAASYAEWSEKNNQDRKQYNKNSCKIIRKHFPIIPGLESAKCEEKNQESKISFTRETKFSIKGHSFTLSAAEVKELKRLVQDLD